VEPLYVGDRVHVQQTPQLLVINTMAQDYREEFIGPMPLDKFLQEFLKIDDHLRSNLSVLIPFRKLEPKIVTRLSRAEHVYDHSKPAVY